VLLPLLRWRTTHYVITTHRLLFRDGILARRGRDLALSRITDVSFAQTASRGSCGAAVELGGDELEVFGGVHGEAGALGEDCRSSPLVFSLLPFCQGLCGSQK
jgi:hypothetical protein